jgi:hypothetical protein
MAGSMEEQNAFNMAEALELLKEDPQNQDVVRERMKCPEEAHLALLTIS